MAKRVAVLEWPFRQEEEGPPIAHRFSPEELSELLQKALGSPPQLESKPGYVLALWEKPRTGEGG